MLRQEQRRAERERLLLIQHLNRIQEQLRQLADVLKKPARCEISSSSSIEQKIAP